MLVITLPLPRRYQNVHHHVSRSIPAFNRPVPYPLDPDIISMDLHD